MVMSLFRMMITSILTYGMEVLWDFPTETTLETLEKMTALAGQKLLKQMVEAYVHFFYFCLVTIIPFPW